MLVGGGRRNMSGYVYSIVCIAAAGGIVCVVSPDSGIKKHLKLVCALCLLCVMIAPTSNFINSLRDVFDIDGTGLLGESDGEVRDAYESIYNRYLEGGYSDNIGEAVKDVLYEKMGVSKENCRMLVQLSEKDGVREIRKITVILSGANVFKDPDQIKNTVFETFGCECECAIE